MPRSPTRNSSHSSRHNPLHSNSPPRRSQVSHSVIEISDDDPSPRPTRKKRAPVASKDVLEISSDDEDSLVRASKPVIPHDLRFQLAKLRKEKARIEAELREKARRNAELEQALDAALSTSSAGAGSGTLNADDLDENVSCEICTTKNWTPYILECGHMFCAGCITGWFDQCKKNHQVRNQNQNAQLAAQVNHLVNTYGNNVPMLAQFLAPYRQLAPSTSEYSCPTCREKVKRKPIEVFGMKEIVRKVAKAQGETSPSKAPAAGSSNPVRRGRSRQAPPPRRTDPFGKYFS